MQPRSSTSIIDVNASICRAHSNHAVTKPARLFQPSKAQGPVLRAFCLYSAGAGDGAGGWCGRSSNNSVVEQCADTVVRPVRASVHRADFTSVFVFEAFSFSQQQQPGAGALLAMVVCLLKQLASACLVAQHVSLCFLGRASDRFMPCTCCVLCLLTWCVAGLLLL